MLDPDHLATLAAIHRLGSFEAASSALHVTPSAVSQRLKALEDRLGTRLVRRGQPATATEAGLRVIRHHDDLCLLEAALARDLPGLDPVRPAFRIAVTADSLATFVLPALTALPDALFDLLIDDQDASLDWLKRGEVVAALTSHGAPLQGCEVTRLGLQRYRATCAPGFASRHFPQGFTFEAFARAPALVFNAKDRLQHDFVRRALGAGTPPALPEHRLASAQGFVEAARLGLGWGMNPESLVKEDIAQGRLCDLAPDMPLDVALYWQVTRLASGALSPLTRALAQSAARVLVGSGKAPRMGVPGA